MGRGALLEFLLLSLILTFELDSLIHLLVLGLGDSDPALELRLRLHPLHWNSVTNR